jgi:hypothetical protein
MNYKRLLLISSCVTIVVSGCAVKETTQASVQIEKVQKILAPNYVKHNPTAPATPAKHVEPALAVSGKPCAFIEVKLDSLGYLYYRFTDSGGRLGRWHGHGHMSPRNQASNLSSVRFSTDVRVTSGPCGSGSEVVIDGTDTQGGSHHWESMSQDGYDDDDVTWHGS